MSARRSRARTFPARVHVRPRRLCPRTRPRPPSASPTSSDGRRSSRELSVLDLAVTHQQALSAVLATAGRDELQQAAAAAGDFFLESLSIFEMVQRGFKEARQAFLAERRNTELSRQLSTFLADASLALEASDSLDRDAAARRRAGPRTHRGRLLCRHRRGRWTPSDHRSGLRP